MHRTFAVCLVTVMTCVPLIASARIAPLTPRAVPVVSERSRVKRVSPRSIRAQMAQRSSASRSSLRSSSSSSRSSVVSSSSRSSSSSSVRTGLYDPLNDRAVISNYLLLDTTSPILAGAKFFSNNEPLRVTRMTVRLQNAVPSIESLIIYDADGRQLGIASQQSDPTLFTLTLNAGLLILDRRVEHSVYIRARMKSVDQGGSSGEYAQVASVEVGGDGVWSNETFIVTSTDTFPTFQTARGVISRVTNIGSTTDMLSAGSQLLGSFRFDAKTTDGLARVRLKSVLFQIAPTGGVTLSNVVLRDDSNSISQSCSISGQIITCDAISPTLGTISTSTVFRVYGTISIPSNANNPSLFIALSDPGNINTGGSITWTDGESTFTWVPLNTPVVRGTMFQ